MNAYTPIDAMSPKRIRLLKFVTIFAIGGTERQVVNLVKHLDRTKFDVQMACLRRTGPFLDHVLSLGIPVSEYNIKALYSPQTAWHQLRFAKYLKQQRIQVLHTYGFYASLFAIPAARVAGVPAIVMSIRDTGELLTTHQRRAQRLVSRLADSILVNAEAVRQWLIDQRCSTQKIEIIRNGIAFDPIPVRSGNVRSEFRLGPDTQLIVMLSRLNRLKGIEDLLRAAITVSARFPRAHFLVVGGAPPDDPGYQGHLEREAASLGLAGRVTFTGFRTDVPQILGEATISVLPSLSEGLSNVLLESMAAGVPVVATTVGGNTEIVDHGTTGLLVPARDPASLAAALGSLLENPVLARQLGNAAREKIHGRYSVQAMVEQTEQHYFKVLHRSLPAETEMPLENVA